jgi:hypothetical protein
MTDPPRFARAHRAARIHRHGDVRVRIVRVAWERDDAVCFGDGPCRDLRHRDHVFVHICNANGSIEYEFAATVREITADAVSAEGFEALVEHIPLGRTLVEVEQAMAVIRSRRLLALIR